MQITMKRIRSTVFLLLVTSCAILVSSGFAENRDNASLDNTTPPKSGTPSTVVLVGATGNLAGKYLWQSIFDLYRQGELGDSPKIIGAATGPPEKVSSVLKSLVDKSVQCVHEKHSENSCEHARKTFLRLVRYAQLRNKEHYKTLSEAISRDYTNDKKKESGRLFYLAVSPDFYPQIAGYIHEYGRSPDGFLRVVFEKPFGRNLATAEDLAAKLTDTLKEEEIYRVDHYLGKRGVNVIESFREENREALDPLWNDAHIRAVEIVMTETETCANRTQFYDNYGAIRDVLQNHLTEIFGIVAMDLSPGKNTVPQHQRRSYVFQNTTAPQLKETVLGQYRSYSDHVSFDFGENRQTSTPTAVAVGLRVHSPTWSKTHFILATAKAVDRREAFAQIHFTRTSDRPDLADCQIRFNIQGGPLGESITVCSALATKAPTGWEKDHAQSSAMQYVFVPENREAPNAYYTLIRECVRGNRHSFLSSSELLAAWAIWDPLLREIENLPVSATPSTYGIGHTGFMRPSSPDYWGLAVKDGKLQHFSLPKGSESAHQREEL